MTGVQTCALPICESTERFGVGLDGNIVTASLQALVSGVNRLGLQLAVQHTELEDAAA